MEMDNTLAKLIVEVQKQTKDKYGIELTFDEVVEVVNVQMSATVFGFSRNEPIYWKGFLKFIWSNRRQRTKDKKKLFGEINDVNNNLTDEAREYYNYLAKVVSGKNYKELEKLSLTSKALSAEELLQKPTPFPRFMNFKILTKKQKK